MIPISIDPNTFPHIFTYISNLLAFGWSILNIGNFEWHLYIIDALSKLNILVIWSPQYTIHLFFNISYFPKGGTFPKVNFYMKILWNAFPSKSLRHFSENIYLNKLIHNQYPFSEVLTLPQFRILRLFTLKLVYRLTSSTNDQKFSPLIRI